MLSLLFALIFLISLPLILNTSLNTNKSPIEINITGNNNLIKSSYSIKSLSAKKSQTPIIKNIKLEVFSLSFISPTKEGIIINKVHQPEKNKLILVIPKAFKPSIKPIKINKNPKTF
mgnify:CR=1 FL=1